MTQGLALGEGSVSGDCDDSVYPDGHTSRRKLVRFGDSHLHAMELGGGRIGLSLGVGSVGVLGHPT